MNRQYIHLEMPYNHFHAFFASSLLLVVALLYDKALVLRHVHKRPHLRCLTGFQMCQCCIRDNYLFVNFPAQCFVLLSCFWWFKAFSFLTFPFFYEAHFVIILWGVFYFNRCWIMDLLLVKAAFGREALIRGRRSAYLRAYACRRKCSKAEDAQYS